MLESVLVLVSVSVSVSVSVNGGEGNPKMRRAKFLVAILRKPTYAIHRVVNSFVAVHRVVLTMVATNTKMHSL